MSRPPFRFIDSPRIPVGVAREVRHMIPLSESLGRISSDIVCPYPPGFLDSAIEIIDKPRIDWIKNQLYITKI